MYAIRILE